MLSHGQYKWFHVLKGCLCDADVHENQKSNTNSTKNVEEHVFNTRKIVHLDFTCATICMQMIQKSDDCFKFTLKIKKYKHVKIFASNISVIKRMPKFCALGLQTPF